MVNLRWCVRSAILLLTLALPASARAQQRHFVVGSKVKVVAADSVDQTRGPVGTTREFAGLVVSFRGDTLVLRDGDVPRPLVIAASRITEAYQFAGTQRHMTTGALIGAGVGVGIGLIAIRTSSSSCSGNLCGTFVETSLENRASGAVVALFGGLGAVVGALIGAMPSDKWQPLSNDRVGASVVPTRGGIGVNVSFHWQ